MMLYQMYEMQRLALQPMRAMVSGALSMMDSTPLGATPFGRVTTAALDSFEHTTRTFTKPSFGYASTLIDGEAVAITEEVSLSLPWCDLLHFRRDVHHMSDRTLLIVAPMSGHFATLLRGTVGAFLPDHDVYITDWRDAKDMPLTAASSTSTTTSTTSAPSSSISAPTPTSSRSASRRCPSWPARP